MIQLGLAIIILTVLLFISAFLSKRRFGLLGLSLSAGYVLSVLWAQYAGNILGFLGVERSSSTESLVGVLLILFPVLITLLHGYTYSTNTGRLLGSISFAFLAVAFLSGPLSYAFVNTGSMSGFVAFFESYKDYIIAVGVIVAVLDLLMSKPKLSK